MEPKGNYLLQTRQAKQCFLTYDQQALIEKLHTRADEDYIYVNFLCKLYRISRTTGDLSYEENGVWLDGNSFEEVMVLLDLAGDSSPLRHVSGVWKQMQSFGMMFHRNLLEDGADPNAALFDRQPEVLRRGCDALHGVVLPGCDIGYALPLFEDLSVGLKFWHSDEDFPPCIRFLWDENALMYLKYETMHFAIGLLQRLIIEKGQL